MTLVALVFLCALAGPASGATVVIGPGTDMINATVVGWMGSGDTLVLGPGVYQQTTQVTFPYPVIIRADTASGGSPANTFVNSTGGSRIFEYSGAGTFTIDNLTLGNGRTTGNGGAIYSQTGGNTVSVTSSVIANCSAVQGGAIYTTGGSLDIADSRFTDCSVSGGMYEEGGAIYTTGGSLDITGSTFTGCSAGYAGGAIYNDGTLVAITTTTFSGCRASASGGAITTIRSQLSLTSSTFTDCTAYHGGAIWTNGNAMIITSTTFSHCSAAVGGAIRSCCYSHLTITSTTFSHCRAWDATGGGGAIVSESPASVSDVSLTIISCTFEDCQAPADSGAITTYAPYGRAAFIIRFSRIHNCGVAVVNSYGTAIDARHNWWGVNTSPLSFTAGTVTSSPWLVLGIAAIAPGAAPGGTVPVRANLTWNSSGRDMSADGYIPDGIPVRFRITDGTGSLGPAEGVTENGMNATTFTAPGTPGIVTINATVDGESVSIPVTVYGALFSGAPTERNGNFTAEFTDESLGPVTMWNWSFGDGRWFNTTDAAAASPRHLYDRIGSFTVNLTVTGSFGTHTMSRPDYITVREPTPPRPVIPTLDERDIDDGFPSVTPTATQAGALLPMTVTVNIGGDSKAWQAVVTGTKLQDLIVTGTVQHGPGDNRTAPLGIVYQYISLVPARYDTITHATINFSVPQSWLDENHIDPKSIVLYHQNASGGWEALPTTVLYTKDGTVYFSAESAGFSLFAIAGTTSAAAIPEITVTASQAILTDSVQARTPVVVEEARITTATTAPPAPAQVPVNSPPFPFVPALAVLCCAGLIGGGWYARRWWIRRQNPALFAEYD